MREFHYVAALKASGNKLCLAALGYCTWLVLMLEKGFSDTTFVNG
jgi:hypothetical protein